MQVVNYVTTQKSLQKYHSLTLRLDTYVMKCTFPQVEFAIQRNHTIIYSSPIPKGR